MEVVHTEFIQAQRDRFDMAVYAPQPPGRFHRVFSGGREAREREEHVDGGGIWMQIDLA